MPLVLLLLFVLFFVFVCLFVCFVFHLWFMEMTDAWNLNRIDGACLCCPAKFIVDSDLV